MLEVHLTYDLNTDIDEQAYFQWMKQAILPALRSRGMIEVRAMRDAQNPQRVLVVGVWNSLSDWQAFQQSEGWNLFMGPLESTYATSIRLELWGASTLIPAPLRPPK